MSGPELERESIGALLARLIEDGRALAKAELALFRTDFYRRIARARLGALLLMVGIIMAQAAAVTFLVTLSFVLTPWIGRLGGSGVSVVIGVTLAIVLIRIGAKKLMLVVEDFEEEDHGYGAKVSSALDELFDHMRQRSREARNQLAETVDETQARLHPQALIADLADEIVDQAQAMSHAAIEAIRRRPAKVTAAATTMLLFLFRAPLYRIVKGLRRATRQHPASFKDKDTGRPAPSPDKETSS